MGSPSPNVRAFLPILLLTLFVSCMESRGLPDGFRRVDCLVREDPSTGDELAEVQSAADWKPCAPRGMDRSFSGKTYWFRLRDPIELQPLILVLEWKVLWEVDLFSVSSQGVTRHMQTGIRRVRSTWPLPIGDYPAFPIETSQKNTWYLRLYSGGVRLGFPISLLTREEFERRVELESQIEFAYAGILLPIVALAFLFAAGLRERLYAYYGLYLFFLWLNRNANYGNAFRLLYPEWPWVAEHIVLFTLGCTYLCSLLFFRKFTRLGEFMPLADRITVWLQYMTFVLIALALTAAPRYLLARTYILLYVVSILAFLFVIFFLVFRHGQKSLWLFAAGWSIFYLAAVPHILYLLGILPYSIPAAYGPALILPLEALLFAGGLFQRYRAILSEKDALARQNAEILARMESFRLAGTRYARSRLSGKDVDALLLRLNEIMEIEKVFLEEQLTLGALAGRLEISAHEFSELLNSRLRLSFPQLLLHYRVAEAERLMKAHPEKTLIEIAFESGFNSKTSFNVGFKKLRGVAPSKFGR